jgi:rod shape-determining protein MreC
MLRVKFWLIILSIILIMLNRFSFLGKVRDTFTIFFVEHTSSLQNKISNYPKLIILETNKQKKLETENSILKKQLEEYAIMAKEESNAQSDGKRISELNTNKQTPNFKYIIARATIDINYLINNKLLINKGANDNIRIGNAVLNKDGVVGQVSSTNGQNSQVALITNNDFKIYLEDSHDKNKMLAEGIGNNNLLVKYINKEANLSVGDILVTTGLDDLYPANTPVAKIIKIFKEENGFNSALCVPVVNFNHLQYVIVLDKKLSGDAK